MLVSRRRLEGNILSETIQHIRQRITEFEQQHDVPPFVSRINELVNQQAWKEAEQEEKRAIEKIAEMWEIVQAVATEKSTCYRDNDSSMVCLFCDDFQTQQEWLIEKLPFPHADECIVTKARKLVQESSR